MWRLMHGMASSAGKHLPVKAQMKHTKLWRLHDPPNRGTVDSEGYENSLLFQEIMVLFFSKLREIAIVCRFLLI